VTKITLVDNTGVSQLKTESIFCKFYKKTSKERNLRNA
jgi:hypothetical protein